MQQFITHDNDVAIKDTIYVVRLLWNKYYSLPIQELATKYE